jgi:ABC-type multidrug transport system fused ATPase/permease subunit
MTADLLLSSASLASDLVSRTSSTFRVQEIVQLSLAPAFLLGAIGAVLNVMNIRLGWISDRVEAIEKAADEGVRDGEVEELPALRRRLGYAHLAIYSSTAAAALICLVIALMFVGALVRPPLGTFIALAWILAMACVFTALVLFLLETRLATRSSRDLRRLSRRMAQRGRED